MNSTERFRLRDVDVNHPAMQVTMPLVSEHDGELRCVGTGFAVAPGLAITAAHVVDGWRDYQERRDKGLGSTFSVAAYQLLGNRICEWWVDAIHGSVSSDIAFLRFLRPGWWGDGPGQVKPRCARLNLNPPAVGDELRVFGFPQSELKDGVLLISPSECTCRVLRVDLKTDFPFGFRPLSHIDIEGEILDGMSGGPCFDDEWNVIGVNSKGWDGQQLAHVALLWPAMKIQIDLFKAGTFPAIDLFKEGAARAIGYRRVYVTSKGEARLAKVDPGTLVALPHLGRTEHLPDSLNFAGSNAQDSLIELRSILEKAHEGAEPLDVNRVLRCIRHYFWELETALRLALLLAARKTGFAVHEPPGWEELQAAWRGHTTDPDTLDELATLDFDWHGVDLFEVRAYAELSRSGELFLYAIASAPPGQIFGASLEPVCRRGGQQIFLPDGLDRFMEASRRFVRKLLDLSSRQYKQQPLTAKDAGTSEPPFETKPAPA